MQLSQKNKLFENKISLSCFYSSSCFQWKKWLHSLMLQQTKPLKKKILSLLVIISQIQIQSMDPWNLFFFLINHYILSKFKEVCLEIELSSCKIQQNSWKQVHKSYSLMEIQRTGLVNNELKLLFIKLIIISSLKVPKQTIYYYLLLITNKS